MVQAHVSLVPTCTRPDDEPFTVNGEYFKDNSPTKVNLGIGVYRTEEGLPWPLPVVEEAEQILHEQKNVDRHEYLTIQGDVKFLSFARDLAFNLESDPQGTDLNRQRIISVQTVSGTGANHIGAQYLSHILQPQRVWVPDPTWGNHHAIWEVVGVNVKTYPYYDESLRGINFAKMAQVLGSDARPGDVVLLHACAHNPTGSDPTREQWLTLIEICQQRGLIPFLDMAYQGFASGDVVEDAWVVKTFYEQPALEFCVAQSFSKNFGLYGQRAGALHVVIGQSSAQLRSGVLSVLSHLVRAEYSMAPRTGSDIVRTILSSDKLRMQWQDDLQSMSQRIKSMRQSLYDELVRLETPGTWTHIIEQIGMFSYTGLTEAQVMAIRRKHHIYMLRSGRISMSGVTSKNVAYIAKAFDDVVRMVKT